MVVTPDAPLIIAALWGTRPALANEEELLIESLYPPAIFGAFPQ